MARRRGFTYIWFLVAVTLLALASTVALDGYAVERQREREDDLLWVGHEYHRALASYYAAASPNRYPHSLDDLLADTRFPTARRHIRELYPDPLTGKSDWSLVVVDDAIVGVYSNAPGVPLKQAGFDAATEKGFDKASSYAAWKF